MPDQIFSYSEDILQWIWEEQLFDFRDLRTTDGNLVSILSPGILNKTDGPDFKNARILIDGVLWAGAVELHLKSRDWKQHRHQSDKAYNQVVLHVVAENSPESLRTENGGSVPTLNLLPYLPDELHQFILNLSNSRHLPCSKGFNYISEKVFSEQLQKAHKEYLEKKGDDFLGFYNPDLVPSKAWKQALILSVFDAFGITHNREAMVDLGRWFLKQECRNKKEAINEALIFSGFGEKPSSLQWNYKGMFPASHPERRIPQAVQLAIQIENTPITIFFDEGLKNNWSILSKASGISSSKLNSLFGIVFLPAMFIFGNLFGAHQITKEVLEEWNSFEANIPSLFTKPFNVLNRISPKLYKNRLGIVHQHRTYCEPRRCQECFVLKKVISS